VVNPIVRLGQAVALAIDPVDYGKVVNGNMQEPIDSIFRHDSPVDDPSITQRFNNPAKAQQLIDAWSADDGGAKLPFTMTVFQSTNYQLSAQYVHCKMNVLKNVKMDLVTEASAQNILERRYSWVFHTPSIRNFKYADDGMPFLAELWIKTH
jgi:ABC-type transport system substrate-binding protein